MSSHQLGGCCSKEEDPRPPYFQPKGRAHQFGGCSSSTEEDPENEFFGNGDEGTYQCASSLLAAADDGSMILPFPFSTFPIINDPEFAEGAEGGMMRSFPDPTFPIINDPEVVDSIEGYYWDDDDASSLSSTSTDGMIPEPEPFNPIAPEPMDGSEVVAGSSSGSSSEASTENTTTTTTTTVTANSSKKRTHHRRVARKPRVIIRPRTPFHILRSFARPKPSFSSSCFEAEEDLSPVTYSDLWNHAYHWHHRTISASQLSRAYDLDLPPSLPLARHLILRCKSLRPDQDCIPSYPPPTSVSLRATTGPAAAARRGRHRGPRQRKPAKGTLPRALPHHQGELRDLKISRLLMGYARGGEAYFAAQGAVAKGALQQKMQLLCDETVMLMEPVLGFVGIEALLLEKAGIFLDQCQLGMYGFEQLAVAVKVLRGGWLSRGERGEVNEEAVRGRFGRGRREAWKERGSSGLGRFVEVAA